MVDFRVLKYSRVSRLSLFLVTAQPTFLVTVIPRRHLSVFPGKKMPTKNRFWTRFPALDNRKNSHRFNSLSDLLKKNARLIDPCNRFLLILFIFSGG